MLDSTCMSVSAVASYFFVKAVGLGGKNPVIVSSTVMHWSSEFATPSLFYHYPGNKTVCYL